MAKALVIGVETTTFGQGAFSELPGVRADVAGVSAMLAARGFAVSTMEDEEPTMRAVAERLGSFVESTSAGELGVIYLAGHGYYTPDVSADEEDGWDECFVCSDDAIVDDWFREELWPAARPGSRFVVVVDACHSGTLLRGVLPIRIPRVEPIRREGELPYHRLLLAACRDKERTFELGGGDDRGGVVTTQMLEALGEDPGMTYAELWPYVAARVRVSYPGRRVPVPQASAAGPDDSLLAAAAFAPSARA